MKEEIMDDFLLQGPVLEDTLDKLAGINKWLGGNKITLTGIKKLLEKQNHDKVFRIVDLGCGGGDMLRLIADYGRKNGYNLQLVGVDANENTLDYARERSMDFPEISYRSCSVFSNEFKQLEYDIALATLFLHHFEEDQILELLNTLQKKATLGVIINDLHRHPMAYYLFQLLCLVIPNDMVRDDGLASILKGFRLNELEEFSKQIGAQAMIRWKWAFRYQWIIDNKAWA